MAQILNPEYRTDNVYNAEGYNEMQMYSDSSTVTSEQENMYKSFASQATKYANKVRRKKAYYDWHTKNTSFVNLYNDLYKMGISNNKFFLRLYDTDLAGVDVYSYALPKETQIKIFIECLINPWYWLREVLRIPVDGLAIEIGGGVPYRIDRNNLACWYLFLNGIDFYQSKPRQQGKTQDCLARFNYAYHFGNMSSNILFFNKDQDQANVNLYRLKCQRDMMPSWLQMKFVITEEGKVDKGVDNTKSIRNPVTGNSITTMGKATNKESAMKLGRGATACLQYFDEFDFTPFQTEIMNAASFAYSTAARNAKAHNSLYGRVLSSTPGDLDTRDGENATEYISHMLKWDDHMLDEPIDKLRKIINGPSYNRFVFVEHSWQQLKLPMEWYEEQCGLVSFDLETIMREIELKRIHGSNQSPFKREDLMYIMNHQKKPIDQVDYSKNLCPIKIYQKLRLNKPYIMAIDPSEGLAADNNAMTLIDPVTQEPVAEFESPYISQPDFCRLLVKFLDDRCPKSMIIIENNKGRELINCFLETRYKYQVYYDDGKLLDKVVDKHDLRGQLVKEAYERRAYGISTTKANRWQYYGILENLMEERKNILVTPNLVRDICGLIRKPSGKVEAGPKAHDDSIMSYLIGLYVFYNAEYEKLQEYGISRGMTDDYSDYDEETGKLTEEGTLNKLKNLLPSLPENMKQVVLAALRRKDPVTEANHYYQEVAAIKRAQEEGVDMSSMGFAPGETIIPSTAPQDEAFWVQYDEGVWRSNQGAFGIDPTDPNFGQNNFDIEDFI